MLQQDIKKLCDFDNSAQRIAEIYCKESISTEELNKWFSSVDFEALIPQVNCMAATAGMLTGFVGIPENVTPRLRGIIRYVHTLNSGMFAGVWSLGAKLKEEGIPLLVTEDTALYMNYQKEPQRHLWQTFLSVKQKDFKRALKIAREEGFGVEEFVFAAIIRKGPTQQMIITSVSDTHYQWQNVTEITKGNASVLSVSLAVMFIDICKRIFRTLTKENPRALVLYWMMDMRVILSKMQKDDWYQAAQLANNECVSSHIHMLISIYSAINGVTVEYKDLFENEKTAKRLVGLLNKNRNLYAKGSKISRLILRCRIRRPDSIWHTCRLCIKELLFLIKNRFMKK